MSSLLLFRSQMRPGHFSDGSGVFAAVHDLNGGLLIHKRRMICQGLA